VLGVGALGVVFGAKAQAVVGRIVSPFVSQNGSGPGALLPGANRFRLYTVTGGYPFEAADKYQLSVTGRVRDSLTLTLDDLRAMPATRLTKDFQCVTGWRVPDVHWVGVRLSEIIDRAGPSDDVTGVEFYSFDGVYSESLTLDQARRYDVIVAYEMLGADVTVEHGGPVRLYVAPMYGYKSCKWLRQIQLVRQLTPGYWEQQGYSVNAWVGDSNGLTGPPID
jgi:DMSO/TMAO reductase YedYZ molybdopterin-dependent catalytic subunit